MRGKASTKHKDKFCLFYNAHGHTTATYFDLKNKIGYFNYHEKLQEYHKEQNLELEYREPEQSKVRLTQSKEAFIK